MDSLPHYPRQLHENWLVCPTDMMININMMLIYDKPRETVPPGPNLLNDRRQIRRLSFPLPVFGIAAGWWRPQA
jgi:hypothetical protein